MKYPLALCLLLLVSCRSSPVWGEVEERESEAPIDPVVESPPTTSESPAASVRSIDVHRGDGPDFLEFPKGGDAVVASVGSEDLRKSQVYDYMLQTFPEKVRSSIAVMLSNRVLAVEVAKHGIRVDEDEIDRWWASQEKQMRERARLETGRALDLETWLLRKTGQGLTEYERVARNRERSKRLLSRLVRYQELLEDRVRFRIISLTDPDQARKIRGMLEDGADFAALARTYSIHPSAENGGLMFPVWRLALNPALERVAFDLPVGSISPVIEARDAVGRRRFQIVRIVERHKGRKISYRDVEDEIIHGLTTRPMSEDEWYMWQLRVERMTKIRVQGR